MFAVGSAVTFLWSLRSPGHIESNLAERVTALVQRRDKNASPDNFLRIANQLKSSRKYEDAAIHYLAALQLKPDFAIASYQLACNFALWGKPQSAIIRLRKAVDSGFWGYETIRADSNLDSIRKLPEFGVLQETIQQRYAIEAPKHAGGSLIRKPTGQPPSDGWPIAVLLHGYGTSKEGFRTVADCAVRTALLALPSPDQWL